MAIKERKVAGKTGIVKQKEKKKSEGKKLSGTGLWGEWIIEDETRTGVQKPTWAKRSMKDLRGFKSGPKKKIDHSRMTSSKKKGDKMDQWTKYYK